MKECSQNDNSSPNNPKVTVYITNHNYGHYLEQSIKSVLNQTMHDFELIVIDDGSTDDSRKIIERYAPHEKIMAIFQQNKGLNITNNIALRSARGDYIMRLDADDYLDENALAVLAGVLDRNSDIGLVFPDYFLINESDEVIEVVRRHDFDEVSLLDQPAHGACTMFRRACLLELGGYDESLCCHDGYDIWIRFIKHYKVQNVNLPLFYYRRHSNNLTRNEDRILEAKSKIIQKQAQLKERQTKSIAVIPVRGKRLNPGSIALAPLGGLALIDWTILAALHAERISDVLITTSDKDILSYIRETYGNKVLTLERENKLALTNTFIEETIFHAIGEYTNEHTPPDIIAILYCESPFRNSTNIDNAIDLMEVFETDSVVAVIPDNDVFYNHNGGGFEPLRKTETLRLEREDMYREVGKMHIVRRDYLELKKQIVGGEVGHILLNKQSALIVESEWDIGIAEYLVKHYRIKPSN